jgi:hypothetical protein
MEYFTKMSEFIKQNKLIAHIFAEIACMCCIVLYINNNNKRVCGYISGLEAKITHYENILQKHENMLNKILDIKTKKVTFKTQEAPPKKHIVAKQKSVSPPPPPRALSPIYEDESDDDIEVIQTKSVEEDYLDEEISDELNRLDDLL